MKILICLADAKKYSKSKYRRKIDHKKMEEAAAAIVEKSDIFTKDSRHYLVQSASTNTK